MSYDYAKSLKRMEEIRTQLESPEVNLDQSLQLYEEGIGLYRQMKHYLDEMEKKFQEISKDIEAEDE